MKKYIKIMSLIGLASIAHTAYAAEITDTYNTGDTLTATSMETIKNAINDNDTNIGSNTTDIGNNSGLVGANTTAINDNSVLIGANTTAIDDNSELVGANTTAIDDNSVLIGANTINIGINSDDITAHDLRITDLEGASPAIGRIALTVSDGAPTKSLADAVTTSATSTAFPSPSDYVAGGKVNIKALVSGCSGSNARVSISSNGVSAGSNTSFFIIPSYQTIAIPVGVFPTFFVVEVTTTTTFLSDLNFVSLTRSGADANDTCSSSLVVRGYIVEYPRR